ncbi:hypothetical protein SPI_01913 [Niveomyces insectorum RCEF 264]|uniref:Uncharacterized protein n=1 Tax=Niveomyces insectorum RCEF 264 TaxID=1081102 RepID=A0A167ZC58_9HYPO|nr:hypothetical protein SPI_01913 [Niveomyces insectorum RCEF 264]
MFSQQSDVSDFAYPRSTLKRFHEDEAAAECINGPTMGFTEHRNKRLHTLPFRTSPTARKWTLPMASASPEAARDQYQQQQYSPSTMTPPGSFVEELPQPQPQQQQQQQHQQFGHPANGPATTDIGDVDMDMSVDVDDDSADSSRAAAQHHHNLVASRMPTPIQPSFAAQVRGNTNWSGAAGNVMHSSDATINAVAPAMAGETATAEGAAVSTLPQDGNDNLQRYHHNNNLTGTYGGDRSVPRSLEHPAVLGEWSMVRNNRSLPSPISESGGEGAEEDVSSPEMVWDAGSDIRGRTHTAPPLATPDRPSALGSSSPGTGMEAAAAMTSSSPCHGRSPGTMDADVAATPSPRKGHSRSRHTLVAWTQQPGMKKSFSIGYRADCEKCRNRVPGHFNHIIVS